MKYCTGRFLDRGGEAVDEGSIQVNSLPSSVQKKTVDKGLPDSTVLASEANRYPCTIVPVQCEHASTVQKNTGMRALPEIQCDTEGILRCSKLYVMYNSNTCEKNHIAAKIKQIS